MKMLVVFLLLATVGTMCVMEVNAAADCMCPFLHAPVCGNDGVTYNNQCLAHCNAATVVCAHECPCAK